jgi:peptide/nickel transport system ATP-binding protein
VVALLHERMPVLSVRDLTAGYAQRSSLRTRGRRERVAVSGVSFDLAPRSCLAVVGESGSGKTTLARCIAGLHGDFSGEIAFEGGRLACQARDRDITSRRMIQIVFQDPDSSLNPSMTVGTIVGRPLKQFLDLNGTELHHRIGELLERVHLAPSTARRYPSELSGGEKQRVAIARAVAAEPRLLICDEVTSALDVAVQASILELLAELRQTTEMSMLFVSHDLAVVRSISDAVIVMAEGTIREARPTAGVFETPQDEYTARMLAAAPDLRPGDYPGYDAAPKSAVGGTTH